MSHVDHIAGMTFHGRKGDVQNAFRYSVDYLLLDAEATLTRLPRLFKRNGRAIAALNDEDHGGAPGQGIGAAWVRGVLRQWQVPGVARIELLAQPKLLGHVFNPVSFWLCRRDDDALIAVIAEVTNTYGDRHSYLVRHADHRPIAPDDRLMATKIMHVSPFQPVEGGYEFRFDFTGDRIGVWIDYSRGQGGLIATLTGQRAPLSNGSILRALLRRPFGSRRVLALIHWQALKLWWKGARFRSRPTPPQTEVSQ
ncbi:MAG: DUF1365 domain-containing protein [Pseudomonadota bacterium]